MQDQPRSTNLSGLLEDARRRLVETRIRNRLIHVNRSTKRANVLDIVLGREMAAVRRSPHAYDPENLRVRS